MFALSVLVFLWTLVRAVRAEALSAPVPAATPSLDAITRPPLGPAADIQIAVEKDLFSPDRSAPDAPYRMPGENAAEEKVHVEPIKPMVLGTAVASDGRNFATLQLGDASPTLVHAGDKIGEWLVKSIARGKVVLVTADGSRAELAAPNPGPP
jgi:hypothetical protein